VAQGSDVGGLYDDDVLLWSERQAALLLRRAAGELVNDAEFDWRNIAEEIESVGISERRALASHIRNILEHLIKLEASPASMPRAGWRATIARSRLDVAGLLRQSPSLEPGLDAVIAGELAGARSIAAIALAEYGEAPRAPIEGLHYSRAQVMEMWFPAGG
jgi:Domain of unknown function DUF29